jgi:hypothetical protein
LGDDLERIDDEIVEQICNVTGTLAERMEALSTSASARPLAAISRGAKGMPEKGVTRSPDAILAGAPAKAHRG